MIAMAEHESHVLEESVVRRFAADDPMYQLQLAKVLAADWHQRKSQEVACLRPFYDLRDRLAVNQDLVTYTFNQGCVRLVIPEPLYPQVAANLHIGHQGLDSMQRRTRQCVYWPGLEADLQHYRVSCTSWETNAHSQPAETLIVTPPPEYSSSLPWQTCSSTKGIPTWCMLIGSPDGWKSPTSHTATRHKKLRDGVPTA
ncbi:hypothetical protein E2C01_021401 [Portunus trituberculatus]|uniref:RNA-directed DNA polymerase n=1 Tax=Portunus trituberculatus TaxID=210409 RepID=A0A5B7E4A7_PORTR|nr:hypothetical protein [Portunus trituberculatus]